MTGHASFIRKIIYLVIIMVLLLPLYLVSHPATNQDQGGTLARMRTEHRLSQANLGEIDPAGASMSLATLGMRGVAANLLWGQAIHYKKTENWDGLKAALNQITKLQPNFESVWVFQAWNLSYNVSVEFDDYRHRYHWVKRGIDYLINGTRYNTEQPSLLHEVGRFFQHKIGRADERLQYRELFRNDTDFHAELREPELPINMDRTEGPDGKPDNWLVADEWYRAGVEMVDTRNVPLRRGNPLLFFSNGAMALIYFADAIEEDGYLDENGQTAWANAHQAWVEFGNRGVPTSYGKEIRLNDLESVRQTERNARQKLDELMPGTRETLREQKRKALAPEYLAALDTPPNERTAEMDVLAQAAVEELRVTDQEVAAEAPPSQRSAARRWAKQAEEAKFTGRVIDRYRDIINFDYWLTRSEAEQLELAISARKHVYDADKLSADADLEQARVEYELGWQDWAKIYERFPILIDDAEAEEVMEAIERYKQLMGQLDEQFPPPEFPLIVLLETFDEEYMQSLPQE